jgi:threonine dehydratase
VAVWHGTPPGDDVAVRWPAAAEMSAAGRDPVSGLPVPTPDDVRRARGVVSRHLRPTPLLSSDALDERLGFRCLLKCENLQPIGAFKVRGGVVLMDALTEQERSRGVVTASTGNHGQSIAWAAHAYGVRARVYMPREANPLKVASMRRLGAEVVCEGDDFDACRAIAEAAAARSGELYVQTANEPRLIAGVGTYALEVLDEAPEVDVVVVPVGGGSGAAGACIAGKGTKPDLRVVGVGAAGAPAGYHTWVRRQYVSYDRVETFAEGVATRQPASLTTAILWRDLDDFRLVDDGAMRRAILTLLETTRMLTEGAGAAALAAARAMRDDLAGKTVCVVLSGGNLTLGALADALATERPW